MGRARLAAMARNEARLPDRRASNVRLASLFAALLALIACSLLLQARWLTQLADAQRGEARRILGVAAERMARDVTEDLARFNAWLARDPDERGIAEARFEGWAAEIVALEPGEEPPPLAGPWLRTVPSTPGGAVRLVVLDPERLQSELFPARVRAAFGEDALERLRVTVVATAGSVPPLYDSVRGAPPAGPPDASAGLHLEASRWVSFFADGSGASTPVEAPIFLSGTRAAPPAPYRIEVRHRAGSLDAALLQARRRNLWIGAGILVALVASAALLWVGEQRARRLAEKELAFVAGVSHELRTPLTVIRTAASNLRTGIVAGPERVREYGALIEQEATRVGASVERVLRFGAAEEPAVRERVELRELAGGAVERARLLADRRRFTLELDVPPDTAVLGDRAALVSLVANLLENAIQYGPDGQTIRLQARAQAGEVALSVADQGPGLAPGEHARVFEPFFRGSAARRANVAGSGLGLALVARIARAHGGRVEVGGGGDSEGGAPGGAVFTLHLPRAGREGS